MSHNSKYYSKKIKKSTFEGCQSLKKYFKIEENDKSASGMDGSQSVCAGPPCQTPTLPCSNHTEPNLPSDNDPTTDEMKNVISVPMDTSGHSVCAGEEQMPCSNHTEF